MPSVAASARRRREKDRGKSERNLGRNSVRGKELSSVNDVTVGTVANALGDVISVSGARRGFDVFARPSFERTLPSQRSIPSRAKTTYLDGPA